MRTKGTQFPNMLELRVFHYRASSQINDNTSLLSRIYLLINNRLPLSPGTLHTHTIMLTAAEMVELKEGKQLLVVTSMANGHQHELKIRWNSNKKVIFYEYCGTASMCRDRHARNLILLKADEGLST